MKLLQPPLTHHPKVKVGLIISQKENMHARDGYKEEEGGLRVYAVPLLPTTVTEKKQNNNPVTIRAWCSTVAITSFCNLKKLTTINGN